MVDSTDIRKAGGRRALAREVASRASDPHYYGVLSFLPNPDTVLRKLGKSHEVFDALTGDAHIVGELRSVRAGLLGYEWRLQAGGETPVDMRALALCELFMSYRPTNGMRWADVIWNIAQAVFRGYRVHEVVWERQDRMLMPCKVLDRPERRFVFGEENELRLLTRQNMMDGVELGPLKWLLTRHMPSHENPYGVAVFSACFWPYTFKHNGWKYFVKFCEKYGLPWAVGKYPPGTPNDEVIKLVDQLAQMVEDAVGAVPGDGTVDLVSSSAGGSQLPQERLIQLANREMSKALTSQTLAPEIQGQGSRAAAETHRGREQSVNESDRGIICATFNELFGWITELNVAGAQPPTFEFFEEAEARQEWVEVLDKARTFMAVPVAFAHERLQIPQPAEGEDVLPGTGPMPPGLPPQFNASGCPHCGHDHAAGDDLNDVARLTAQAAGQADELIERMADEVRALLDRVETLEEFRDGLAALYPNISEQRLGEMTSLALMTGALTGMTDDG